jgi:hypothetical protein
MPFRRSSEDLLSIPRIPCVSNCLPRMVDGIDPTEGKGFSNRPVVEVASTLGVYPEAILCTIRGKPDTPILARSRIDMLTHMVALGLRNWHAFWTPVKSWAEYHQEGNGVALRFFASIVTVIGLPILALLTLTALVFLISDHIDARRLRVLQRRAILLGLGTELKGTRDTANQDVTRPESEQPGQRQTRSSPVCRWGPRRISRRRGGPLRPKDPGSI